MSQNNQSFEQSLAELERLVAAMDDPQISLADALAAFERGVGLTRECFVALNAAKGRLNAVRRELDALISEPFELDSQEPLDE